MNLSKRQIERNIAHNKNSATNTRTTTKTSTELEFDFDFDDLDNVSDINDDDGTHDQEDRPYQWGTNIQFVNIDVNNVPLNNRSSNSFHTQIHFNPKPITLSTLNNASQTVYPNNTNQHSQYSDDEKQIHDVPSIPYTKLTRQISTFVPQSYDICSVISFPLSIERSTNMPLSSLEYIRSHLPDSNEFNNYLHDILYQSGYKLRVANYIGTVDNISSMLHAGGSKILHFIAYIWNPMAQSSHPLCYTFPTHDEYYKCDTDYILIERSSFTEYGSNGKWIKVDDLRRMIKFDIDLNDIMITISPQSVRLCNVFRNVFGYKYVIGVECGSNNYNSFSSSEAAIFLKYFYSSILHQECLDRAFELAKTAAVLQRKGATNTDSESDTKYILLSHNDNNSARFVAFPQLIEGKPHDVSPHTCYDLIKTNLRRIIRPFIGRASDAIHLIHNIIHNKASLVIGEENHGRSAVIQNTVRYLLQHLYFGACFVIDLEDKRNYKTPNGDAHDTLIGRLYDALRDEIEIECDEEEQHLFLNYDTISTKEFTKNLFRKLNNDSLFDSICIILLNMNQWKNHNEMFEFIHVFNTETNDKCRIILSTDTASYNSNLINSDIPVLTVPALNRECVSKVFESYLINCDRYDIKDIISHHQLHQIFNGSARIAKRVAEFVNSESMNNDQSITLDDIAVQYTQSAFAKSMNHKQEPKQLLTVTIPHVHNKDMPTDTTYTNNRNDTMSYHGWNTSFADKPHIEGDHTDTIEPWELSKRCESFEASLHHKHLSLIRNNTNNQQNTSFPFWNVSYTAKPKAVRSQSIQSRNYSEDTYSTECDSRSGSEPEESSDDTTQTDNDTEQEVEPRQTAEGNMVYTNNGYLAIKSISITSSTDHRLTDAGLRKRLSPRAHRRHNTYSIPDFCTDDPITNIFTNIAGIPEATEEEYTYQNDLKSSRSNDTKGLYAEEYSASFPDISKLDPYRSNDKQQFEIVISDEHCNPLPLTPVPTKTQQKQNIVVYEYAQRQEPIIPQQSDGSTSHNYDRNVTEYHPTHSHNCNQSMDFDGLSTYTTSSKRVPSARQQQENTLHLNLYDITSYRSIEVRDRSQMTKSSQCTDYCYVYPEYTEYESCSDDIDENIKETVSQHTKPLPLSPKDSDDPVVETHLAKINDKQSVKHPSITGYNSGSDDTLHSDDTPSPIVNKHYHVTSSYYRMPITPKHKSESDVDSDSVVEEMESEVCAAPHDIITKKGSVIMLYGRHGHASNRSLSNKQLYDVTDTLSLRLMDHSMDVDMMNVQEEDVEDDATDYEEQPIPQQHLNDDVNIHLNVIAHLARIKDPDATAIWMHAGSHYNQYAYLYKLYPFLVQKFQITTRTKHRFPQIQELEHYFLKMGGKYLRNTNFPVIHITKYNKFYGWFMFMCAIVSDLRQIYDDYNLECLFYGKRTSSEILRMRPQGTFVLSLTNKMNCLAIKYKKTNKSKEISSILLMRHSKDSYSVIKAKDQTKASLFQIIRPRTYLKFLYTPQMLIDKKALF
eukprot:664957_1